MQMIIFKLFSVDSTVYRLYISVSQSFFG